MDNGLNRNNSKRYSNSLLATLNSRAPIFQHSSGVVSASNGGAHVWQIRPGDIRSETTTAAATSFGSTDTHTRKTDVEIGTVQPEVRVLSIYIYFSYSFLDVNATTYADSSIRIEIAGWRIRLWSFLGMEVIICD